VESIDLKKPNPEIFSSKFGLILTKIHGCNLLAFSKAKLISPKLPLSAQPRTYLPIEPFGSSCFSFRRSWFHGTSRACRKRIGFQYLKPNSLSGHIYSITVTFYFLHDWQRRFHLDPWTIRSANVGCKWTNHLEWTPHITKSPRQWYSWSLQVALHPRLSNQTYLFTTSLKSKTFKIGSWSSAWLSQFGKINHFPECVGKPTVSETYFLQDWFRFLHSSEPIKSRHGCIDRLWAIWAGLTS